MFKSEYLNKGMMTSLIKSQSIVKPISGKFKRVLATTLILTSLVDAFSILVIYLLLNTSSNPETLNVNGMELPTASQSLALKTATTVRIEGKKVFIGDTQVSRRSLQAEFETLAEGLDEDEKVKPLVIQADKKLVYPVINPIILAATQAGFNKFKFAVIQGGNSQ